MRIEYTDSPDGITPRMLHGFFVGWRSPRTAEEHLEILAGSDHVLLAIDTESRRVIGFATALTDGVQAAFIPLLEVLPEYQRDGIGTELMRRLLEKLRPIPCVDLTCDPQLQPFYARLEMTPSIGMIIRKP